MREEAREEAVKRIAFRKFQVRQRYNIEGDALSDYYEAEKEYNRIHTTQVGGQEEFPQPKRYY